MADKEKHEKVRSNIATIVDEVVRGVGDVVHVDEPYDNVGPYGGESVVVRGLVEDGEGYVGFLVAVYSDENVEEKVLGGLREKVEVKKRKEQIAELLTEATS